MTRTGLPRTGCMPPSSFRATATDDERPHRRDALNVLRTGRRPPRGRSVGPSRGSIPQCPTTNTPPYQRKTPTTPTLRQESGRRVRLHMWIGDDRGHPRSWCAPEVHDDRCEGDLAAAHRPLWPARYSVRVTVSPFTSPRACAAVATAGTVRPTDCEPTPRIVRVSAVAWQR